MERFIKSISTIRLIINNIDIFCNLFIFRIHPVPQVINQSKINGFSRFSDKEYVIYKFGKIVNITPSPKSKFIYDKNIAPHF